MVKHLLVANIFSQFVICLLILCFYCHATDFSKILCNHNYKSLNVSEFCHIEENFSSQVRREFTFSPLELVCFIINIKIFDLFEDYSDTWLRNRSNHFSYGYSVT